jgi:hypothetical protein
MPGDFNRDAAVDAADYVVWRDGLGTTYTSADFESWRAHFGDSATNMAASGTSTQFVVAEPVSLLLAAFVAAVTGSSNRRDRSSSSR